jgi:UPF0755 protein
MSDAGGFDGDGVPGARGVSGETGGPWDDGEPGPGPGPGPESAAEFGAAPERTRHARSAARSARVRRRRRVVGTVLGGLVVLVMAFTLWYELESHALGPEGRLVVVTVHDGESINAVLGNLSGTHVIGSSLAFRVSDFFDGNPSVAPGSYALHENLTFGQVRAVLAAGPDVYTVIVNPGLALHEVASQVDAVPGLTNSSFVQTADNGTVRSTFSPAGSNDLEGLLGTGTYLILPGESDTTILRAMVQRFERQAAAAGLDASAAQALGLTPYEVVTAASVVEKEGYLPPNMPDVARTIYNRLAADMPLQMDSTVLYALGQDGGPVTPQDEQIVSPYNSYLNKGLPPTPICSPSPQAMAAAAHPPPGAWLYFVLVNKNGTEAFADTYAEQLANEALARSRGVG